MVQVPPTLVQASLGAPGDLDHARIRSGLASGERLADHGTVAVVVGGLDEQPACVGRAGLGDRPQAALFVRGPLARHDPQEPGQHGRPGEAVKVADLGAHAGGGERVDRGKQRSLAITGA